MYLLELASGGWGHMIEQNSAHLQRVGQTLKRGLDSPLAWQQKHEVSNLLSKQVQGRPCEAPQLALLTLRLLHCMEFGLGEVKTLSLHCSFKTFLMPLYWRISRASCWPWIFVCSLVIWLLWRTGLRRAHKNVQTAERERTREWKSTYWLRSLDGHKPVVALLPADIAEGPVVPGVLGDVADLVDWVVMQEHLHGTDTKCYRIRRCGPCEIE